MKITVELDTENPEHQPILLALVTGASGFQKVEDKVDQKPSTGSSRQRKNVEREDKPADPPPAEQAKDPEPEPPAEPEKDPLDEGEEQVEELEEKFTEDQVRVALKNYRSINGADATMAALKDHGGGATGMGSLKPEFYAAVMKVVR